MHSTLTLFKGARRMLGSAGEDPDSIALVARFYQRPAGTPRLGCGIVLMHMHCIAGSESIGRVPPRPTPRPAQRRLTVCSPPHLYRMVRCFQRFMRSFRYRFVDTDLYHLVGIPLVGAPSGVSCKVSDLQAGGIQSSEELAAFPGLWPREILALQAGVRSIPEPKTYPAISL